VPGLSNYQALVEARSCANNLHCQTSVNCPTGTVALSGGYQSQAPGDADINYTASFPIGFGTGQGWFVSVMNRSGRLLEFNIHVVCAAAVQAP